MAIHNIERCGDGYRTSLLILVNPRCACAARVTVVAVPVCLCVCVCVCVCHISPLGPLFVLKTTRAMKVKIFVAFSLKLCRSRATALPALYG